MRYIKLYENWQREEKITLTSRNGQSIEVITRHGKIDEIINDSKVSFPFHTGQLVTVFLKAWACNHGFKWNGKDACDPGEKKVFGIKAKHIPKGHELRQMFPGKFRD